MRQLLTACYLALSGVCISAFPDTASSTAKPSATEEAKASAAASRAQPDQPKPSAPADAKSGATPGSDDASRSSDQGVSSGPSAATPDASAASAKVPSREEFCKLLMSAAEDNGLPIGFFVNLIWQESRFVRTAVSSAGALGVAQFMPAVAESLGLRNPFDPRQALPTSAQLLRTLHSQFGNLGLAAAAYNAGPKRVLDWLAKRGGLPRETRNYVLTITGRPAEHWMNNSPPQIPFLVPPRVPCFEVEAFAAVVKPADSVPPRESTTVVKSAETTADTSAAKISRSAAKQPAQSVRPGPAYKQRRIEAVTGRAIAPAQLTKEAAKRFGPAQLTKEAAKKFGPAQLSRDAARKFAKELTRSLKEAKPIKAAAKRAKDAAKSIKEAVKSPKEAAKRTKEAALSSKTGQR